MMVRGQDGVGRSDKRGVGRVGSGDKRGVW